MQYDRSFPIESCYVSLWTSRNTYDIYAYVILSLLTCLFDLGNIRELYQQKHPQY